MKLSPVNLFVVLSLFAAEVFDVDEFVAEKLDMDGVPLAKLLNEKLLDGAELLELPPNGV